MYSCEAFHLTAVVLLFPICSQHPRCVGSHWGGRLLICLTGVSPQLSFWQSRPMLWRVQGGSIILVLPGSAIQFSKCPGFKNPSIFLTDKKSGGGPLFRVEKNIFLLPLTYNGEEKQLFPKIFWKISFFITPLLITASISGIFNGLRRNIFSILQTSLYLSKGHEKAGCPNENLFICTNFLE